MVRPHVATMFALDEAGYGRLPYIKKLAFTPDRARALPAAGRDAERLGDGVRNPDLGATLRGLARDGAKSFYEGELAHRMVEDMRAHGGPLSLEDLAGFKVQARLRLRRTAERQHAASWADALADRILGREVFQTTLTTATLRTCALSFSSKKQAAKEIDAQRAEVAGSRERLLHRPAHHRLRLRPSITNELCGLDPVSGSADTPPTACTPGSIVTRSRTRL